MSTFRIKIAGGGIAGLASALAVANAGGQAVVFERAQKFEALGAGLQIGPNAARALQYLGAWEEVEPLTVAPPAILMRDGETGKLLKRLPLGEEFRARYGMPYRTAYRADLLHGLLRTVRARPNIEIVMGVETTSLDHDGFDGLLAADGVWSKLRGQLFPNAQAIKPRDVFFRSLIPMPNVSGAIDFECVNLWLFPGGHVVHYPVGNPARLNLVAITTGDAPSSFYAKAHQSLRDVLALAPTPTSWPSAYMTGLNTWNQGNISLIGDAAHATLPYLAQGAAMALEDAAVLQNLLSEAENFSKACEDFSVERIARTNKLHARSIRQGQIYHMKSVGRQMRNIALQAAPKALILGRLGWVY
ncbi:MAG: FAD-dependent monooxygenase, partial [Alphaproteobacteria bacterium]|nr:FAD-dependent monooxygenase [Alphaproteobacteria bacterium]